MRAATSSGSSLFIEPTAIFIEMMDYGCHTDHWLLTSHYWLLTTGY